MFRKLTKLLYRSIENKEISYKKMQEILKKDKNSILLDVRSKQEFKEYHLEGAINIPLYDLEETVADIIKEKDVNIITCCASGYRSRQAKMILEEMEYKNVYNLKNGLDGI